LIVSIGGAAHERILVSISGRRKFEFPGQGQQHIHDWIAWFTDLKGCPSHCGGLLR
jgi:hypothetical protein